MSETTAPKRPAPPAVFFERRELNTLLSTYGVFVAAGEWKDYAIDSHTDRAIFSVFRRASEAPLYSVEKQPKLRNRQGAYAVIGAAGQVLKRGHDLRTVLKVFDRQKLKLV